MAVVAVERELRGVAREHGGDGRVWRGAGRRNAAVAGDLVAGKRRNAGGIFRALAEITNPDGGFEISRGERHIGEIHGGDLHFHFGGSPMVRPAIIARP